MGDALLAALEEEAAPAIVENPRGLRNPEILPTDAVIELTQNYYTVISKQRYSTYKDNKWSVSLSREKAYAFRKGSKGEGKWWRKNIFLHRSIMGVLDRPDIEVDHRDGCSLNNRDSNLIPGSRHKNMLNIISNYPGSSSKYRGVCIYDKDSLKGRIMGEKRCVAYFNFAGERHWVGTFHVKDEEQAAKARDAKVRELLSGIDPRILNNILNFPDPMPQEKEADIPF